MNDVTAPKSDISAWLARELGDRSPVQSPPGEPTDIQFVQQLTDGDHYRISAEIWWEKPVFEDGQRGAIQYQLEGAIEELVRNARRALELLETRE